MSSTEKLRISLQEIASVTNNFDKENIIGRGGYGVVYRGRSEKHGVLAIKRLNRAHGQQGDHEYGMEVTLLSKYKHENLVSLVGFCGEGEERILVYKYEANQSLDKFLKSKDLSWMCRLEICLGAARGLRYLHKGESGQGHGVIHRDIKSSNILLDENWKAKVSDFGLCKIALTSSADSVLFTVACGTHGYVDPHTLYGHGITQKSDVYSFGVVLFEVLFGKLVAIPGYLGDERFTVEMARNHYEKNTLDKMIDADLRDQISPASLSTFSTVAYECLKNLTEDRPTMSLVVEALEKSLVYQQQLSTDGLSSSGFSHDVYISYPVIASPRYLVKCLHEALGKKRLSTYKCNISTSPRNELLLLSAIRHSRAFIIIFSKHFFNSWNLEEVAEIMKCVKERGNAVLTVFDTIGPPDIEEISDKAYYYFHEAVPTKIEVWRNALIEAANVPGIQLPPHCVYDALVQDVAANIKHQVVLKRPKRRTPEASHRAEGQISRAST